MTTPKKTSIALPPKVKMPEKTSIPASPEGDIAFVTTLAHLLEQANVTEIEVERAGLKVRVSRASAAASVVYAQAPAAAPAPAPAPAPAAKPSACPGRRDRLVQAPRRRRSCPLASALPILSPQPGAPAFVQVGDTVKEDQTLLIVEAMKTNPIPAPKAGRIVQIFVVDARPVEYGEVLMIIE